MANPTNPGAPGNGDVQREIRELKDKVEGYSRLSDAASKLTEEEKKLTDVLERGIHARRYHRDVTSEMDTVNRKIASSFTKSKNAVKKAEDNLGNLEKKYQKLKKAGKGVSEVEKEITEARKQERRVSSDFKGQQELLNNLSKIKKKIDDINSNPAEIQGFEELNRIAKDRLNIQKELLEAQRLTGQLSDSEAGRLKKQLDTTEAIAEAQADLAEARMSGSKRDVIESVNIESRGDLAAGKKELGSRYFENQRGRLDNIKQLFGSGSGFGGRLGAMRNLEASKAESEGIKGAMGMADKQAKGLTGSFKALGGAMKALGKMGWIGLIIEAVMMLGKAVNDLDKFVKGFNQSFVQMYGPIDTLGDIGEETRRFTDSIFDVKRNLKYGTKAEDIMGMYGSLTGSGMSLNKVDSMAEYNSIVEEASKLHLQLGTDIESVGSMIEKQMFDMVTSFDKAAKSLRVIGYDASKSGVNMQKFYEAALASAEGLAYYGNYLTKASSMLKEYQKMSGMSHQEATKQTQEMMNYIDGLDATGRAKIMSLAGEENIRERLRGVSESANKEAEIHKDKLAKLRKQREKADGDEAGVLDKKIAELEEKRSGAMRKYLSIQNTLKSGNEMDPTTVMSYLSGQVEGVLGDVFERVRTNGSGLDIFDSSLATEMFAQNLGLSKDAIQKFRERSLMELHNAREHIGKYGNAFQGDQKTRGMMSGAMDDFIHTGDREELLHAARSNLDAVNNAFGSVQEFMKIAEETPTVMQKILDGSALQMTEDQLKSFILESTGDAVEVAQKFQAKKADDVVKYTHTIEDFLGISREVAKYAAARNVPEATKYAMATVEKLSVIVSLLEYISKVFRRRSDEEFKKSDEYSALQKGMYELELLKRVEKEQALTGGQKTRKEELKVLVDKLSEGRNKVVSELTQDIYKKIESRSDVGYKGRFGQAALSEAKGETDSSVLNKKMNDWSNVLYGTPLAGAKIGWEAAKGIYSKIKDKPAENDYVAMTDGLVRLTRGDVVVNSQGVSDGVGGEKGQFLSKAIDKMSRSKDSSSGSSVSIPVSVSIGSVNGDAQEIVTKIKPAMEQAFERMYFEKQKRGN